MALITRITRLFQSDLHAVLDQIEEPDILLRQAVREMQESIDQDEQRSKLLKLEHEQLSSREADCVRLLQQIAEELDVCFDSGNDDLARGLIRRKLEVQRLAELIDKKQKTLTSSLEDLAGRLEVDRGRMTAMQQKADILTRQVTTTCDGSVCTEHRDILEKSINNDDVEVAFLREKQRWETS